MTPRILRLIHSSLNHDNPVHVVFWGICLLAFPLLFRKSNLIPTKVHGFNPKQQLRHEDCFLDFNNEKVVVGIRWAKNHQFSKELLTFSLPFLRNSVLCPLRAIINIRRLIPFAPSDHLFQLPQGGSMTYRRFQTMLHEQLKVVGVPFPNEYSSHSFRRGGTTFSFLSRVLTEMIKLLGNWSSDAYLSYLEFPLQTRTATCELIKIRILALEAARN